MPKEGEKGRQRRPKEALRGRARGERKSFIKVSSRGKLMKLRFNLTFATKKSFITVKSPKQFHQSFIKPLSNISSNRSFFSEKVETASKNS